jgi:hypothetical protein
LGHQRQHLRIVESKAPGFDDEQDHIDVGKHAVHGLVECSIEGRRMASLKAGRIDKHVLRVTQSANAGDAVPSCLRLARSDADLLPNQGIEKSAFADVGATDDRDQPAAPGGRTVVLGRHVGRPEGISRVESKITL